MSTHYRKITAYICLVSLVATSVGCQTAGGSAAVGGGVGAGLGAIIGNQSGHAAGGALIGLAAGAVTGLVVHDIKKRRQRSAEETAQGYNYLPSEGQRLRFENARVEPTVVRRGEMVEATAQYALLGANRSTQITESWVLRTNDREISQLSSYTDKRDDGTWVSTLPFRVPENLAPGKYHIAFHAQTSENGISGRADFVVQ